MKPTEAELEAMAPDCDECGARMWPEYYDNATGQPTKWACPYELAHSRAGEEDYEL